MQVKRDQKDDRQWKADQPEQGASYKSHPGLSLKSNHPLQVWFPDSVACSGPFRFLAAQMPCGTRGVVRLRLHRVAVTTTASVVLARDHALRTITTVATFAWINTNSKFPFDDGCSSCLEQY